jgi:hypothetical protein
MATITKQDGRLVKLIFIACTDANCANEKGQNDTYSVMFNPNTIALKLAIDRTINQAQGQTAAQMPFNTIKPQDYVFEFVVDGTGANGQPRKEVPQEIEKFLQVVYNYQGSEHQPNYIKILYGAVLLKCVLKTVDITYNLFNPNGKPLRAKVNASFISCVDQEMQEMINSPTSPDITHMRKMKRSDKLVGLSNMMYKKNTLYVEVARANGFDNFRNLPEGTEIYFPPISKT